MTFIYYLQSVVCLVCPVLPVSLDCPFLILLRVSLMFIYSLEIVQFRVCPVSLDCTFLITLPLRFSLTFIHYLECVLCLVYPVLSVSLDCPFWIAASVFYDVYLLPRVCPMSCVPSVVSVSGLSVLDCRLGFL